VVFLLKISFQVNLAPLNSLVTLRVVDKVVGAYIGDVDDLLLEVGLYVTVLAVHSLTLLAVRLLD